MISMDATTQAAFEAASTLYAKNQVIVSALANPVSIKVYNGSNSVMGSGTMQTPWATIVDHQFQVGQVVSFAVTTGGTPDANWYLRFESGTRWIRGSFGLKDSGRDFEWSKDAWNAGTPGQTQDIALGEASNANPRLAGAAQSLTFTEGIGGTYNFGTYGSDPDGDPVTYQLASNPILGVQLASSTGILTVTAAAVASVYSLTIRVIDINGDYYDHPCTLTVQEVTNPPGVKVSTFDGLTLGQTVYTQDPTNWSKLSYEPDSIAAKIDATVTRAGNRSVKFSVDRSTTPSVQSVERCEIRWNNPKSFPMVTATYSDGKSYLKATTDVWFGWSIYIPTTFKPLYNQANGEAQEPICMQIHRDPESLTRVPPDPWQDTDKNPAIALKIIGDANGIPRWVVQGDKSLNPVSLIGDKIYQSVGAGTVTTGVWTDWVFQVRYDPVAGYVKAWSGISGTTLTQVASITGGVGMADLRAPYLKIGWYQPVWDNTAPVVITVDKAGNVVGTATVWHDDFRYYIGNDGTVDLVKPQGAVAPADWPAATIYVKTNETNGGTYQTLPVYNTINNAIAVATAGSVIEIVADVGTTQTIAQSITISGKNGTATNPITLRARDGHTITVQPTTAGNLLYIANSNYWNIVARQAEGLRLGNIALWTNTNPYAYPHNKTLYIFGTSSHIWFKKIRFSGGSQYGNIDVNRRVQKVCYDNCLFEKHGLSGDHTTATGLTGDGVTNDGRRVLYRNCELRWFGGHNMLLVRGAYSVVRGGHVRGDWRTIAPARALGYRMSILNGGDMDAWDDNGRSTEGTTIDTYLYGPLLCEGVWWDQAAYYNPAEQDVGCHKHNSYNLICRGNLYTDFSTCMISGWGGPETDFHPQDYPTNRGYRYYHNTLFNVVGWGVESGSWYDSTGMNIYKHPNTQSDYRFVNNLIQQTGDTPVAHDGYSFRILCQQAQDVFPTPWREFQIGNNVFFGTSPSNWQCYTSGEIVQDVGGSMIGTTGLQATYPQHFYGNVLSTSGWVNAGTVGNRTFDLQPQMGAGLNDAAPLTTVSTAATNATQIRVADASWFYDGGNTLTWDLGYFGEVGDYIAIGTSLTDPQLQIRQIASIPRATVAGQAINVPTGIINLTSAVTVAAGSKVWFAGNPNGRNANMVWANKGSGQIPVDDGGGGGGGGGEGSPPNVVNTTAGSGLDLYNIDPWRSTSNRVDGWDWSYPSSHALAPMSGMFQFSKNIWPTGFPGRKVKKIDMDWGSSNVNKSVIEPSEGNFTLDWVATAIRNAQYVQIDVRQTCRSYDPSASGAKGRQTTPTWLQAKLPTQGTHWVNDIYGQTTYLPWNADYKTYHGRMMDAIRGEPCASYPVTPTNPQGGFRIDGYRLFDHPKVMFVLLHGLGGNSEEFTGTAAEMVKSSAENATAFLNWMQTHWFDKVGTANIKKLSFVGSDRPWYRVIKPMIEKGCGTRGGVLEHWLGWRMTPQYSDSTEDDPIVGEGGPMGVIHEAYKNSAGVVQTGNPYPVYMDVKWDHLLRDQTVTVRHRQDQNEEYRFEKITPDASGIAVIGPPVRYQQNYRYSMLRGIMMQYNNISVEDQTTGLNSYGGVENFVNPPVMAWTAMNMGHLNVDAPEAFCALIRTYNRSTNTLVGSGAANLEVNNFEHLMKQREIYGATTVDLRRGHGVDPTDSDYNTTGKDTILGHAIYQWTPAFQDNTTAFPKTLWHLYLARRGAQIGFWLNQTFIGTAGRKVAIKVTYLDNNTETWTIRTINSMNTTVETSIKNDNTGKVRTATVFVADFKRQTNASLWLIGNGLTPFMLVRVIKVV